MSPTYFHHTGRAPKGALEKLDRISTVLPRGSFPAEILDHQGFDKAAGFVPIS